MPFSTEGVSTVNPNRLEANFYFSHYPFHRLCLFFTGTYSQFYRGANGWLCTDRDQFPGPFNGKSHCMAMEFWKWFHFEFAESFYHLFYSGHLCSNINGNQHQRFQYAYQVRLHHYFQQAFHQLCGRRQHRLRSICCSIYRSIHACCRHNQYLLAMGFWQWNRINAAKPANNFCHNRQLHHQPEGYQ